MAKMPFYISSVTSENTLAVPLDPIERSDFFVTQQKNAHYMNYYLSRIGS